MAGDWVKLRLDLHDDPATIGIAAALGMAEDMVVGKLHRAWGWANRHTFDGNASGVTAAWLDRYVCTPGFAQAMCAVGWLVDEPGGIVFPRFDRHNSEGAKQRALTAQRVAEHRQREERAAKSNASRVTAGVTPPLPDALPEKRREEKSKQTLPPPPPEAADAIELPAEVDCSAFRSALKEWIVYRDQRKPRLTPLGLQKIIQEWSKKGVARFVAAVQYSICQGWQGIYENKSEGNRHVSKPGPGVRYDPAYDPYAGDSCADWGSNATTAGGMPDKNPAGPDGQAG